MMRFGGRRRQALPLAAEINITNLVDVAFVLLIIFMITAPILQGGIEVQLPEAPARPLENSEAVVVSVAKDGQVFIEKAPVTMQEFQTVMRTYVGGSDKPRPVMIKGDTNVQYGKVTEVLGILKEMNLEVSLAVEPPAKGRRR
jgi:biopolymer transport protein ExbD